MRTAAFVIVEGSTALLYRGLYISSTPGRLLPLPFKSLIVVAPFLFIAQHLINFCYLFKHFLRCRILRMQVRVIPAGQVPVPLLYLSRTAVLGQSKGFVQGSQCSAYFTEIVLQGNTASLLSDSGKYNLPLLPAARLIYIFRKSRKRILL